MSVLIGHLDCYQGFCLVCCFWYVILNNDVMKISDKCPLSFYLKLEYLGHKVRTAVTPDRHCETGMALLRPANTARAASNKT